MGGVSIASRMVDDQELMRRLLARYTLKECAALMGVGYHSMLRRARRPEFLEQLKNLNADIWKDVDHEAKAMAGQVSERLLTMSSKALDVLEAALDSSDEKIAVSTAKDILDRNPDASKTTKHQSKVEHTFMNPRVLIEAAKAAQEMDELAATLETDFTP